MSGDEAAIRLGITIFAAPSTLLARRSGASSERVGPGLPDDGEPAREGTPSDALGDMVGVGVVELAGTRDEFPEPAVLGAIIAHLPGSAVVDVQAPRVVTMHRGASGADELDRTYAAASSVDRYALWERFRASLASLSEVDRLGCVIVRLPIDVEPSPESWAYLATLPERLPGIRITVEPGPGWLAPDRRRDVLHTLADIGVGYAGPPLAGGSEAWSRPALRAACAVVRTSGEGPSGSAGLGRWVRGFHPIVSTAFEVHVLVPAQGQRFAGASRRSTGRGAADVPSSAWPSTSSSMDAVREGWHRAHQ